MTTVDGAQLIGKNCTNNMEEHVYMDNEKKKFTIPEAEIVTFVNNDIITASNDPAWVGDDNMEDWA